MPKDITIKKGLTIRLNGEAQKTLSTAPRSRTFVIKPSDFHLVIPKMVKNYRLGMLFFILKKMKLLNLFHL